MKEVAMHLLDIVYNSIRGKAKTIDILVDENPPLNYFHFIIRDDGVGIAPKYLNEIKNPFVTTRKLRKVGLGLALLNSACQRSGGDCHIFSKEGKGTIVIACMEYNHIDRPPLGDISSTIAGLITSYEKINMQYVHNINGQKVYLSTAQIKENIGNISLNHIKIYQWIQEYLNSSLEKIR